MSIRRRNFLWNYTTLYDSQEWEIEYSGDIRDAVEEDRFLYLSLSRQRKRHVVFLKNARTTRTAGVWRGPSPGRPDPAAIGNHEKGPEPSYLPRLEVSDLRMFDGRETCRKRNVKERAPSPAFRVLLSGRGTTNRLSASSPHISRPYPPRETLPVCGTVMVSATWLSVAPRFSELGVYMVRKWIDHPSIIVDRYSVLAPKPFPPYLTVQSSPPDLLTPKLLGLSISLSVRSAGCKGGFALHFGPRHNELCRRSNTSEFPHLIRNWYDIYEITFYSARRWEKGAYLRETSLIEINFQIKRVILIW